MNLDFLIQNTDILYFLDDNEIINLLKISKKYLIFLSYDWIWKIICIQKFNIHFWNMACKRDKYFHTNSWKEEYIRIFIFEKTLKLKYNVYWNIDDYYNFWKLDNIRLKKLNKTFIRLYE